METYTLEDILEAAEAAGLNGQAADLVDALQARAEGCYRLGNGEKGDYSTLASWLLDEYERLGGWREVGDVIGLSGAAAWRIAHGTLRPNQDVIARYVEATHDATTL